MFVVRIVCASDQKLLVCGIVNRYFRVFLQLKRVRVVDLSIIERAGVSNNSIKSRKINFYL